MWHPNLLFRTICRKRNFSLTSSPPFLALAYNTRQSVLHSLVYLSNVLQVGLILAHDCDVVRTPFHPDNLYFHGVGNGLGGTHRMAFLYYSRSMRRRGAVGPGDFLLFLFRFGWCKLTVETVECIFPIVYIGIMLITKRSSAWMPWYSWKNLMLCIWHYSLMSLSCQKLRQIIVMSLEETVSSYVLFDMRQLIMRFRVNLTVLFEDRIGALCVDGSAKKEHRDPNQYPPCLCITTLNKTITAINLRIESVRIDGHNLAICSNYTWVAQETVALYHNRGSWLFFRVQRVRIE